MGCNTKVKSLNSCQTKVNCRQWVVRQRSTVFKRFSDKGNSNNTAPSIGTIAGCSDQRERNITTGLFGLRQRSTIVNGLRDKDQLSLKGIVQTIHN